MTFQVNPVEELDYRLILMLPGSRKVLVLRTANCDSLPSVRIPQRTRIARELQKAIQRTWKLNVIVLDLPRPADGDLLCAIAEVLFSMWNGDKPSDSPFFKIGWIDRAIAWLEAETGKRLSSKRQIEQYNAGG